MLLQRKHSQSVVDYTFSAMPRNAFKAPKTKRSPAKPEPEGYTSVAKKRRTKDDFYTFCTIVLSYTQYESLKREELRQQNNISPVGSGGSAADSYSSDSTASLSSGSLQESIPESLQEALPIDRVQDSISSASSGTSSTSTASTTTTTVANCRLTDRLAHPQLPKQQQFVKQQQSPKHSMFVKQQQQQHVKQQQHSKLQLLKQQQSQQQQQQQHIKPLVQPKQQQQQQAVARQLTKQQNQAPPAPPLVQATLLPPLSSVPPTQHNSNRLDGFYHRNNNVEADLSSMSTPSSSLSSSLSSSSSSTSLSSSSSSSSSTTPSHQQYSPHQKQKLQQQQQQQQQALVEDIKVKHLESVQLEKREECSPCEHHLKTHIKQEEKPCVDDLKSSMINHTTSTTNPVTIKVEKDDDDEFASVLEEKVASSHHHHHHRHHHHHHHFPKMDLHQSTSDSHNESCGESVHSNCSSADAIESDDESWDLITCHCLKPYAGRPMIECSECSTWIHLSCAKIRKSNIPETFVCQQCREAKFTTRKSNRIRTESKRISI